jgi:hypothetical protein
VRDMPNQPMENEPQRVWNDLHTLSANPRTSDQALRKTFELAATKGPTQKDFEALLGSSKANPRDAVSDLGGPPALDFHRIVNPCESTDWITGSPEVTGLGKGGRRLSRLTTLYIAI